MAYGWLAELGPYTVNANSLNKNQTTPEVLPQPFFLGFSHFHILTTTSHSNTPRFSTTQTASIISQMSSFSSTLLALAFPIVLTPMESPWPVNGMIRPRPRLSRHCTHPNLNSNAIPNTSPNRDCFVLVGHSECLVWQLPRVCQDRSLLNGGILCRCTCSMHISTGYSSTPDISFYLSYP